MGAATAAVRRLRATRAYADAPVPVDLVTRWLEAARWCGSSRNAQTWRFVVVRDPETLEFLGELGEYAGHLAGAPLAIAIASEHGPYPFSTVFDLGRVSQSLMLAASDDGVGSCIAVFEPPENIVRARTRLGVPTHLRLDLAIAFGFPAATPASTPASPSTRGRFPLEELAFDGRYGRPFRPSDR